ncbi:MULTISPECIES: universal stress protein [unclassified Polaribacter]|uniref:universal stress protein n=1 Tax=unclassified Polaribacter TaxID=196858 RepID=UPI0011BFBD97|nr:MULTISPECIES: universal stress protein [unclassified Polaribacter]TXD51984.1 universal stress protein [Polaribacter sp. IC063]TXD58653.1 universal stress protein [Polaribacter sp. IC066]
MKKKIVLPTDFSKNALNAINYATELYKTTPCEFFILHSYYLPGSNKSNLLIPEPTEKKLNEVKERAEKNMEILKKQALFNEDHSKHTFHFLNEFGSFQKVLKKTIEKKDVDLILMGTLGETDDKNTVFGSNAVNTMENIRNCPVIAIPNNIIFKNSNEIVFPTSFKINYKDNELATLIEVSKLMNAPIRILYVKNNEEFSNEQIQNKILLNQILEATNFTHHQLFNMNMQEGVRCFAQSRESEMIAFVNKKHNFFGSVFSNPMVKDLGANTNIPLLAMHNSKK